MRSSGRGSGPVRLVPWEETWRTHLLDLPVHKPRKGHVRTQQEGGCLHARKTPPPRNWACWTLILGFLVSKTVGKEISMVWAMQSVIFCYSNPGRLIQTPRQVWEFLCLTPGALGRQASWSSTQQILTGVSRTPGTVVGAGIQPWTRRCGSCWHSPSIRCWHTLTART